MSHVGHRRHPTPLSQSPRGTEGVEISLVEVKLGKDPGHKSLLPFLRVGTGTR